FFSRSIISFRKAIKKAIELTKKTDIKGVKVKIAGRLAGKEIARAECIKKGRLPL
uniref:Small ribosomal subunit protein uS3 C-terminal domain-containing protein n=1 Tax=Oryza brachyantha TaxID=4533 RepID=J3MK56_ORYBR